MTVVTPPTIVPNSGRPPEDDLDGLLRTYFKAELPDPWPSFEAPVPRNGVLPLRRPKAPNVHLWRSRLALAASIFLLITGALFLFGYSGNAGVPAGSRLPGEATAGDDRSEIRKSLPAKEPNIVVDPKKGSQLEIEFDLPMR